jgi:hypothetical protein
MLERVFVGSTATLEVWEPDQVRITPEGRFNWPHFEGGKIFEQVHQGKVEEILHEGAVLRIRCLCGWCRARRAKGIEYDVLASKVVPLEDMDAVTIRPPEPPSIEMRAVPHIPGPNPFEQRLARVALQREIMSLEMPAAPPVSDVHIKVAARQKDERIDDQLRRYLCDEPYSSIHRSITPIEQVLVGPKEKTYIDQETAEIIAAFLAGPKVKR